MFLYFIQFLTVFVLFGKSIADDPSPCGDWIEYKDEKCFKVFDSVAKETTAETVCRGKDGISILAVIRTKDEQDFITKYLNESKIEDNVWISIKKTDNSFKWLDGTDVKYTNWAKNRPLKGSPDQNCVEISVDEANYGKWLDEKCGMKNAVLCEKSQSWSLKRLQNILSEEKAKTKELFDLQKAEIDTLKMKTIPEQQKQIDLQKIEINNLRSNPVPIGFIYVQLSGQSEPKTLWPNTLWENISIKYSGSFFRAEGGQSSAFGQIQEQQTQSLDLLTGGCPNRSDQISFEQWHRVNEIPYNQFLYTGGNEGFEYGLKFKHNNEEIRPRNQAIRIWQRIK